MRRIGLLFSSMVCLAVLTVAAPAQACPETPACSCLHKALQSPQPKIADENSCKVDATKAPELLKARSTHQGLLDDRLIRPHVVSYDASAGELG